MRLPAPSFTVGETIILGAGPAGLAAAWRLTQAGEPVVVVEREAAAGGLCRSLQVDGCRFDNGPHLFKARNHRVAELWDMLSGGDYAPQRAESTGLYFDGGLHRSLYQPREEKFWGEALSGIDPGWYSSQAASLSSRFSNRVVSSLRRILPGDSRVAEESQTQQEGAGLFPTRGSGGLYERQRRIVAEAAGNRVLFRRELVRVDHADGSVRSIRVRDLLTGEESTIEGTNFVSTIPLPVLVSRLAPSVEADVAADAARLFYRDLVTVNLVVEAERPFPYDIVYVLSGELDAELCRTMRDPPRLQLAGYSAPSAADWKLAEKLGIRGRVDFRGELRDGDLVDLYRGARLLVLASDEEGLGLVILEAMACGLPVVSTDCGGPRTSVIEGETGYLVPRGDARALAARMHAILSEPALRERLGREGRARACAHFSLQATGRPFLDWYDRSLHPPGSERAEARFEDRLR